MKRPEDNLRPEDLAVGRELREHVRGLDRFIPTAPPLTQIERRAIGAGRPATPRGLRIRALPVGIAGVALAFLLVLASGLWGPRNGPASSPSATSVETALPGPSNRPTTTPAPTRTTKATPVPTPTLPPGAILQAAVQTAAWSPDNSMIAVTVGASGEVPYVTIIDPTGREIQRVAAFELAWLGSRTFVALVQGPGTAAAFVGEVGSQERQYLPGDFMSLVGGPAGSVALRLDEVGSDGYQIYDQSGLSARRDGVPVAFSADGALLAVVRYPTACCAGGPADATKPPAPPTLAVVDVTTGRSLATAPVEWAYGAYVAFDPNGQHVAFVMYPKDLNSPERVGILDLETRKLSILEPAGNSISAGSTLDWTAPGSLTLRGWPAGHVPPGTPVKVAFSGDLSAIIARSSDALSAAVGLANQSKVTISRDGASRDYPLPGAVNELIWSRDGRRLLVECGWDPGSSSQPYLVVLSGLG